MPIDVLIVEDNAVFRESLEILLELDGDVRVVAAVGDGRSALEACAASSPDVVVVDYRLPDLDGVETTRAIRATCPGSAVLILTASAEEPVVSALIEAGATACITKDKRLDEIVAAIRAAAEGRDTGS